MCIKYVQKTILKGNFIVRSEFSCVRSSHDLCARAQAHSSEQCFPTCMPQHTYAAEVCRGRMSWIKVSMRSFNEIFNSHWKLLISYILHFYPSIPFLHFYPSSIIIWSLTHNKRYSIGPTGKLVQPVIISYWPDFTLCISIEITYVIDNHCLYVSALFDGMCKDIGSEHYTLLIYKLRWLSKSKVLSSVFKLSHQLRRLLFITLIVDPTWCSKLACYVDIVEFQYAMQRLTWC